MTDLIPVVIDTNVLFAGLTKKGGAEGFIIDVWLGGLLKVNVSNSLAYEYIDVLSRKLSSQRWLKLKPVVATLLTKVEFTPIYYSWRPTSPDPGDDLVIDCAMNANAMVVTSNIKDFQRAKIALRLQIMTPKELIIKLAEN